MKLKLLITAIIILLSTGAVVENYLLKNNRPDVPAAINNSNEKNIKDTLSQEKQKEMLEYLVNGQMSKYEDDNYKTHETGTETIDNGPYGKNESVRYCRKGTDKAGYVVKDLIINTEQADIGKDMYANDSIYQWFIKPRIRVDKNTVNSDPGVWICTVEIIDYEGNVIQRTDIDAVNFLDLEKEHKDNEYYDGRYIEDFSRMRSVNLITIPGTELNPKHRKNKKNCKVDYRIYWWGECDMWLDYVKAENSIAEELFKGRYDDWLKNIDPKNADYLKSVKYDPNQIYCINYLIVKLNEFSKTQITLK